MVELSLKLGGEETNMLESAVFVNSLTNLMQWFFFIIVAISVAKYIKKKNANSGKKKHS